MISALKTPARDPRPGAGAFTVSVDQVTEPEWNELLGRFAQANFYQTWAYGAVSWGEGQLSHLVLREGQDVVAAAQLRIVRLPVVRAGVAYLRWGPCGERKEPAGAPTRFDRMLEALVAEYVQRRGLLLRIIPPLCEQDSEAVAVVEMLRKRGFARDPGVPCYRTMRVDLTAEPELIRKRFDGKWRNQLNAAERNGLTVVEGTGDDLYGRFLELYQEMMARKRFETTVDAEQFRRIQQRLPEPQKMLIMISLKDGVAQTALVATAVGETGIYLLGATSNEGLKSKGSYLLQWRMMNRLKERGCRWYDLGGVNPEANPGVYHFKQGMGGEEVTGLGRFALSASPLSAAAVTAGERLKWLAAKLRR